MHRMKEADPLFAVMFSKIDFTGSYYDGLRIGNPNEFDLNVVFDISVPRSNCRVRDNLKS